MFAWNIVDTVENRLKPITLFTVANNLINKTINKTTIENYIN